jgi:organic hydroperoxide reductase OsmC/OhrA
MKINAQVRSSHNEHNVTLTTNGNAHSITIPPKPSGFGSSANGGELLFLALATCYCNDIYREAAKRGIKVEQVEVAAEGEFGAEGAPGTNISYRARVVAHATEGEIRELMQHTDAVAEIQNTLRVQTHVTLDHIEAVVAND